MNKLRRMVLGRLGRDSDLIDYSVELWLVPIECKKPTFMVTEMKSILFALCALLLVMNASNTYCAQESTAKTPKTEHMKDNKSAQMPTILVENTPLHENGWKAVITDPTAIFTFLIAIFTLLLVWETASSNKRSLRAYVFAENLGLWEGTMLAPPQPALANIPGVSVVFKNSGQTPAYKVVSWAQVAVIEPINEHTLVVPALENKFSNTLGSDGTFSKEIWFNRALTANEIADIAIGVRAIYFYGRIEYQDVFKGKLHSNFRVFYRGAFPPPKGVLFSFSDKGNDAI